MGNKWNSKGIGRQAATFLERKNIESKINRPNAFSSGKKSEKSELLSSFPMIEKRPHHQVNFTRWNDARRARTQKCNFCVRVSTCRSCNETTEKWQSRSSSSSWRTQLNPTEERRRNPKKKKSTRVRLRFKLRKIRQRKKRESGLVWSWPSIRRCQWKRNTKISFSSRSTQISNDSSLKARKDEPSFHKKKW